MEGERDFALQSTLRYSFKNVHYPILDADGKVVCRYGSDHSMGRKFFAE